MPFEVYINKKKYIIFVSSFFLSILFLCDPSMFHFSFMCLCIFIFHCMSETQFTHSSCDGHLDYFQFYLFLKKVVVHVMYMFLCTYVYFSLYIKNRNARVKVWACSKLVDNVNCFPHWLNQFIFQLVVYESLCYLQSVWWMCNGVSLKC